MHPVPTVGGQVSLPGKNAMGPRAQNEIETRNDVLIYTTEILDKPLEVIGPIALRLYISSDAPDTFFTAKLVDVYPDRRAFILTDGILRTRFRKSYQTPLLMNTGNIYELNINMLATANVFLPGHRIRPEISSSNFPRFNRNSNTGGNIYDEHYNDYKKQ